MNDSRSGGAADMLSVDEAFRRLDMDNYDNEDSDIVGRLLQVRCDVIFLACPGTTSVAKRHNALQPPRRLSRRASRQGTCRNYQRSSPFFSWSGFSSHARALHTLHICTTPTGVCVIHSLSASIQRTAASARANVTSATRRAQGLSIKGVTSTCKMV